MALRQLRGITTVLFGFALVGCAFFEPDGTFDMIRPEDGWVRMKQPPSDESLMQMVNQDTDVQTEMNSKRVRPVWFQRGQDDYLLYFEVHGYIDGSPCEEEKFEFIRVGDHWDEKKRDRKTTACVD